MSTWPALVLILLTPPVEPAPSDSLSSRFNAVNFPSLFGGFEGCFVLKDLGSGQILRYQEAACDRRLSPCSTFKIFNALVALDCGVLSDEHVRLKWDGKPQRVKAWERDHDLASAIRDSVLWYFQEVARRIGPERMRSALRVCRYGNQDMSGGIDRFWLGSSLLISANEQVLFLEALYTEPRTGAPADAQPQLPFNRRSIRIVQRLLVQETGKDWSFSGKTGTGGPGQRADLGWFVGYVRQGSRQYVFAMNIRAADGATGRKARELVRRVLRELELLPPEGAAAP